MTMLSRRRLFQAGAAIVPAVALDTALDTAFARASSAATVETSGVAPAALAGFDQVMKTYVVERDIS
ncbi:MAG: beta-lactamase, partial [Nonomuraea muscovyensis]|nr:beta-lactamase [Nonomuraea muscovyensis]